MPSKYSDLALQQKASWGQAETQGLHKGRAAGLLTVLQPTPWR